MIETFDGERGDGCLPARPIKSIQKAPVVYGGENRKKEACF